MNHLPHMAGRHLPRMAGSWRSTRGCVGSCSLLLLLLLLLLAADADADAAACCDALQHRGMPLQVDLNVEDAPEHLPAAQAGSTRIVSHSIE